MFQMICGGREKYLVLNLTSLLIFHMTSQEALRILIKNSALQDSQKTEMLNAVDSMKDEDVQALGEALAKQKKAEIVAAEDAVEKLDEFLSTEPAGKDS
jgi:hypothetical protein